MAEETKVEASFWERFTDKIGSWGEGIINFLGRLFGSSNERTIRSLGYVRGREGEHTVIPGSLLAQVNGLEPTVSTFSEEALKDLTTRFRACLQGEFQPRQYKKRPLPPDAEARPESGEGEEGAEAEE